MTHQLDFSGEFPTNNVEPNEARLVRNGPCRNLPAFSMNDVALPSVLKVLPPVIGLAMAYSAADLRMVEFHIAQGERHILRQEELISRLHSLELPTKAAEDLLEDFRATLHRHREHWDSIASSMASDR